LAAQQAQPEHVGLLAALAGDDVSDVRAAAVAGLTKMVGNNLGSPLAERVFLRALTDPGLAVPLTIAATLKEVTPSPIIDSAHGELVNHPFLPVRRALPTKPA
jgi:hypothetical protein